MPVPFKKVAGQTATRGHTDIVNDLRKTLNEASSMRHQRYTLPHKITKVHDSGDKNIGDRNAN